MCLQPATASRPSVSSCLRGHRCIVRAVDYPRPPLDVASNGNYQEAKALSAKLRANRASADFGGKKSVLVIGGGLAGLSCAKYLSDAGHAPTVIEKVLGANFLRLFEEVWA